ncbi:MAG: signal peptidase I [bacterium]|nr:signal peptidase I [bacterium]
MTDYKGDDVKKITEAKKYRNARKTYKTVKELVKRAKKDRGRDWYLNAGKTMSEVREALKRKQNIDEALQKILLLEDNLKKYKKGAFREFIESLLWAGILALIVRGLFLQPFKIPTGSMEPTLHGSYDNGDRIFVNKIIFGLRLPWIAYDKERQPIPLQLKYSPVIIPVKEPARWDIVVFQTRGIIGLDQHKDYIKRVVGLPGETVEIRGGDIYINGEVTPKPAYLGNIYYRNTGLSGFDGEYGQEGRAVQVPENMYFVLGDNSGNSKDSRYWGFVHRDNILGRAFFIWWPISNRWGYLK